MTEVGTIYCPNCGAESRFGLKFCKHCGESLGQENREPAIAFRPSRITGAVWALSLATIIIILGGLGLVFATVFDMLRPTLLVPGVAPAAGRDLTSIAIVSVIFGSLTTFGVAAMLLKLMSRLLTSSHAPSVSDKELKRSPRIKKATENVYTPVQLPPASRPSVTEHTTRNFESSRYRDAEVQIEER